MRVEEAGPSGAGQVDGALLSLIRGLSSAGHSIPVSRARREVLCINGRGLS